MPHPPTPRDRRAGSRHTAVWLLLISAALVAAAPVSRAAEPATAAPQPSAATETPAAGTGPLTPVHREPPAAAQSTLSSKPTPAAKKPAIAMPAADAAGAAPTPPAAKPPPKQAETATPSSPTPKAAKPAVAQAEEATPRPHRKPPLTRSASTAADGPERAMPADRRATVIERRERTVDVDRGPRRERVYREDYGWPEEAPFADRRAAQYPHPPVYGDAGGEMVPAPFAPPWYYRNRPLAWGPYPGMGFPGPGRW
jgi:hypothetical protein